MTAVQRTSRRPIQLKRRILTPIVFLLLVVTAGFTPWWGTAIVVGACRLLFRTSLAVLAILTFLSWGIACIARDTIHLYGPSRVFAKILGLEGFGLVMDSNASRMTVYAIVSLAGFLMALFAGGAVQSLQNLWTSWRRPTVR